MDDLLSKVRSILGQVQTLPRQFQAAGQLIQQGVQSPVSIKSRLQSFNPVNYTRPQSNQPLISLTPQGQQVLNNIRQSAINLGQALQRFPDTTVPYKPIPPIGLSAPSTFPLGVSSPVGVNLTGLLGDTVRSYGNSLTRLGQGQFGQGGMGNTFEDYGNLAGVLPVGRIVNIGGRALPRVLKPLAEEAKNFSRFDEFVKGTQTRITQPMAQVMEDNAIGLKQIWDRFGNTPKMPVNIDRTKMSGTLLSKTQEQLQQLAPKFVGKMEGFEKAPPSTIDVMKKVGVLDYLRTPDRVLTKIGLGNEARSLRRAYDTYLTDLPKEINRITEWSKRPGIGKGSEVSIFRYLDGKPATLNSTEKQVALEIKDYLSQWADKLKLPQDKRVSNYITHIFEKDLIQKEFDPDLAKILRENVAGSVYDPFVSERLGKQGYIEDVWRALDAYVKRATRKYHMDPELESISKASDMLETSQYNYVKNYIDRVNLRPTDWDNLLDNTIKQMVGYRFGQRPTTVLSQKLRQMIYRGTLGLNPGSAIRNLTQGINTYSKLGEKYTVLGYLKMVKNAATGSDELERVGVLRNDFIQDRTLNATQKFWEKFDKGLFYFFETAEKINRGAAYWGAKTKALDKGLSETEAIEYAKDIVRKTQFTFGSVDIPAVLQSDIAKTVLQFQSFNVKQAEFLSELVKDKDFIGLIRFGAASVATLLTVGKVIGLEPKDMIPFGSVLTGETKLGQTPAIKFVGDLAGTAVGAPDKYGKQPSWEDRMRILMNDLVPMIPAGVQMKKTIIGLKDVASGYATGTNGNIKYPVSQNVPNYIKGALLGPYNLPEAREYYTQERRPLSEKQSELLKQSDDRFQAYQDLMDNRAKEAEYDKVRELVKQTGQGTFYNGERYFYLKGGEVHSLDLNFQPKKPELTGQTELDKKLVSRYRGEITKRENIIEELFLQGKLTEDEAEKEFIKLKALRDEVLTPKAKKPKKVSIKSIKFTATKPVKLKLAKATAPKLKLPKMPTLKLSKPQKTAVIWKPKSLPKLQKPKKTINSLAHLGRNVFGNV